MLLIMVTWSRIMVTYRHQLAPSQERWLPARNRCTILAMSDYRRLKCILLDTIQATGLI